ncbi:MAG: dihydropteroate synthase [Sphaerospermopsis sp. SIO1G2]|nr:dihydropteroate synthase [Sphaerospermopsis sp. SIO1G2]
MDSRTHIVGIVNITPDSFSDGGRYMDVNDALAHTQQLIEAGAHVIDVGAESTRPGATPLTDSEEWARLSPILPELIHLCHAHQVRVSLDTYHAPSAERAIALGIDWINDVSGGRNDALLQCVADAPHVCYVLMHGISVPADPRITLPQTCDPLATVNIFFKTQRDRLHAYGIEEERILYDPGIGFGKNAAQSLALLWGAPRLCVPTSQLFIGHSRKSCFSLISPDAHARDILTLAASSYLIQQQVGFLRVHDVASHHELLQKILV